MFRKKTQTTGTTRRALHHNVPNAVPAAFSYHARRSETFGNVGRQLQRDDSVVLNSRFGRWLQTSQIVVGIGVLCFAVLILVACLRLSSQASIQIQGGLSTYGTLTTAETSYLKSIESLLRSSIWNANKLTLDRGGIISMLETTYPEIQSADVRTSLLSSKPLITIHLTSPELLIHEKSGLYVLDQNGIAIAETKGKLPVDVQLPTLIDQSYLPTKISTEVLTNQNVSFITTVITDLSSKGYQPSQLVLPAGASELDYYITGKPYYVKFNLESNDARGEAGTFLAVIATLQSSNAVPSAYVDVRVTGRGYYK